MFSLVVDDGTPIHILIAHCSESPISGDLVSPLNTYCRQTE